MGNQNLTCWNGIRQCGAKMMTCISAHCISAWFCFLCGLSLSTFFAKQGTLSSFCALPTCLTECVLFQDAEVVAFPGRNPRYLIEVMTNGANHAATAHCRRSRSTHQEPWTLELALSVPPTVGTEFIQYLPGKKIISTTQTPTTSKTESINRLNPPLSAEGSHHKALY